MSDHKTSLNKFKRLIIKLSIFSCYNGIKLGNNNVWETVNFTKKKKKVEMQQHTFEQPVCQRENKK